MHFTYSLRGAPQVQLTVEHHGTVFSSETIFVSEEKASDKEEGPLRIAISIDAVAASTRLKYKAYWTILLCFRRIAGIS